MDQDKIKSAMASMLSAIGEDASREGLLETPDRVARMYGEIFAGYEEDAAVHLSKVFAVSKNELVLEKDITFYSMCEHHCMPFFGKAHIAYIPDGKVVGISKLARTVDVYAKRLQIQEQLTNQIADAIMEHLCPQGVMVILEAEHLCMTMRGVKKPGAQTMTLANRGVFCEDAALQAKVLAMLQ